MSFHLASNEKLEVKSKKLKSATSWHKIFKSLVDKNGWHKDGIEKAGLLQYYRGDGAVSGS